MKKGLEADNGLKAKSEDFGFSAGDTVIVRVRENGDSGNTLGKFEGVVEHFYTRPGARSDKAVINPPWETMSNPMFAPYDAAFEVINQ